MKKNRRTPRTVRHHKLHWDKGEKCWYCRLCDEYNMIADFRSYECVGYVPPPPPIGERSPRTAGKHSRVEFQEGGAGDDYDWLWVCSHCGAEHQDLAVLQEEPCPLLGSILISDSELAHTVFGSGRAAEIRALISEEAEAIWRLSHD